MVQLHRNAQIQMYILRILIHCCKRMKDGGHRVFTERRSLHRLVWSRLNLDGAGEAVVVQAFAFGRTGLVWQAWSEAQTRLFALQLAFWQVLDGMGYMVHYLASQSDQVSVWPHPLDHPPRWRTWDLLEKILPIYVVAHFLHQAFVHFKFGKGEYEGSRSTRHICRHVVQASSSYLIRMTSRASRTFGSHS